MQQNRSNRDGNGASTATPRLIYSGLWWRIITYDGTQSYTEDLTCKKRAYNINNYCQMSYNN